jgi:hypothetical protein
VVEQAKGILAERLRLDMEGAFELLRYAARSEQTKLQEVAAEVVGSEETPPSVVRALTRHAALLAQSPPGQRAIQTERFSRATNTEIGHSEVPVTNYVCECGNPMCTEPIRLSAELLLRLHAEANLFVVVPGHEITDVEFVIERGNGFVIVRRDA